MDDLLRQMIELGLAESRQLLSHIPLWLASSIQLNYDWLDWLIFIKSNMN